MIEYEYVNHAWKNKEMEKNKGKRSINSDENYGSRKIEKNEKLNKEKFKK